MEQLTNFPPSFQENPILYGTALFVLTFLTVASAAAIMDFVLRERIRRHVAELPSTLNGPRIKGITAVDLYHAKILSLLVAVFMLAMPDAVFILSWGEVSPLTAARLFFFDRVMDALSGIPFVVFLASYLSGGSTVTHQLCLDAKPVQLRANPAILRKQAKIFILILFIAVGVTIYKAYP